MKIGNSCCLDGLDRALDRPIGGHQRSSILDGRIPIRVGEWCGAASADFRTQKDLGCP
jgi:hypothetical protein